MMYAKNNNGERILATKDQEGFCIGCGSKMMAKMGSIMVHHWSHITKVQCDDWMENEGEWHLSWKQKFIQYGNNVEIEKYIKKGNEWHFADIYTEYDGVTELQHSTISIEDIKKREEFYEKMVWLFDCKEAFLMGRFCIYNKGNYHTFVWKHCKKSLMESNKSLYLDIGNNKIFKIMKKNINKKMFGWGNIIDYDTFLNMRT